MLVAFGWLAVLEVAAQCIYYYRQVSMCYVETMIWHITIVILRSSIPIVAPFAKVDARVGTLCVITSRNAAPM